MPLSGAASWREPERTQMPTDADRTWPIRSEIIVRPLSRTVCLMGLACSTILHLDAMLTYGLNGAQTEGQKREVRSQRSEVRGQKSEVRGQRSEVRDQRSEVRDQKSEVRSNRARRILLCDPDL